MANKASKLCAQNVRVLRDKDTYQHISDELAKLGHPLHPVILARIEKGQRRIDVDDLMAFSNLYQINPAVLIAGKIHRRNSIITVQPGESDG